MRKLTTIILATAFVIGCAALSYASDWGTAGKVLTVIEGLRVVTGGQVDVIGTITGINGARNRAVSGGAYYGRYERVWVPHYVWVRQYIPRHIEYIRGRGRVMVGGYYAKVRLERGGHWETVRAR